MEIAVISLVAFFAAVLTFFTGFGLGTLLTPVFLIYLPVDAAIAITAVVHFVNNLFKLLLVGNKFDKKIVIQFGIPAILAALAGSWLLLLIPDHQPLWTYYFWGSTHSIYLLNSLISVLLICFALMDLLPYTRKLEFDNSKLVWGGLISGFFGGFSGNQGALRSAFLVKTGMSKECFIATTVIISSLVDFTRLSVYSTKMLKFINEIDLLWLICPALAAISGAYLGSRLLKKILIEQIRLLVAIMVLLFAIALGLGWI
ncbi:MAG: sulfite exporter TauE/SafE family protein [Saprospiraceae bacterium]|nr:sulfite exporter TauE/SafE family protein [Saprospiraceae bacterium]